MRLKAFKSFWDMTPLQWKMNKETEMMIERIAAAGYDGIEFVPPDDPEDYPKFRSALERYGLAFIAQVGTRRPDHIGMFRDKIDHALELNPLFIVAHTAKDSMEWEEQLAFYDEALQVEEDRGIVVAHETHRGRAMFTPWTTAGLLRRFPTLKLNADFSHWTVACESLLGDQQEHVNLAIARSVHIHGRVGYAEGPQVPDPRAPEYKNEVEVFMTWWLAIAEERRKANAGFLTFTPEFGPPSYLHTLPFTNQPVSDMWEVNLWMFRRFKDAFEERFTSASE